MAGKYALYLPFHIITALESEGFSDAEIGAFIRGIIKYHLEGITPRFNDRALNLLFSDNKPEFDHNIEKYKTMVEARREAGKKGGAPRGNANATGNRGGGAPLRNKNAAKTKNKHKQMFEFNAKKQTQAKQADIELDIELDKRISGSGEVVFAKQPTQTTAKTFISTCKKLGYYLDKKKAEEILNAGIDPSWLSGPFIYPEYIDEVIQENYASKPPEQKRKLFRTIIAAEDRKESFLAWRKSKEAEAATTKENRQREIIEREKRRKMDELRNLGPGSCGNCGASLAAPDGRQGTCPSCEFNYELDEERGRWEFYEPKSLAAEFESRLKGQAAARETVA